MASTRSAPTTCTSTATRCAASASRSAMARRRGRRARRAADRRTTAADPGRRRRPRAARPVLPVRPLPAARVEPTGDAAGEPPGDLERDVHPGVGQQVHDQHQCPDELLAGRGRRRCRSVTSRSSTCSTAFASTAPTTARIHYDCRGFVAHHNTDLWADTAPLDNTLCGLWPLGGAWMALHLWDHYDYTRDVEFLRTTRLPGDEGRGDLPPRLRLRARRALDDRADDLPGERLPPRRRARGAVPEPGHGRADHARAVRPLRRRRRRARARRSVARRGHRGDGPSCRRRRSAATGG